MKVCCMYTPPNETTPTPAVYSTNIPPESRFGAIIEKIQQRMMSWQSRHPSIMARVLVANTLLSSCIWFFAYFLVPTEELKLKLSTVWGMIWGVRREVTWVHVG